eukprot:CAMPEP_0201153726 /NCGR_PEP_ID=MMETSP0851-20130426/14094_1 /ASSEMBLY_ACC=CAM_ASM_000631 /TAXON_ID=183588 /ORGANISM="Pseudo-nitzschia fraudulenta, Strain WWA7" /LENGTH=356 /DNA_ID=CAMNT_0047430979 /DNA_START=105 /DNA_END=1175 /DNA_ORIENTATION=+
MALLSMTVLLLMSIIQTEAFLPLTTTTTTTPMHHTSLSEGIGDDANRNNNDNNSDPSFDVENARKRLENLLSDSSEETERSNGDDESDNSDGKRIATTTTMFSFSKLLSDYADGVDFSLKSLPPPPPLSAIERDRRLVEIRLLECLLEGDDAVPELWDHWYFERGKIAKSRLEEIGGMFTDPWNWKQCEKDLIEFVDEYGIYFVEPVNLLATLYFLQGKLDLSYKLCEIILSIKPYHVGALSGIVQVALGLRDAAATREWAVKRLPSVVPSSALEKDGDTKEEVQQLENPRRVEWVETAVAAAKELLDQAERRTQEDFFGKPETYYNNSNDNDSDNFDAADGLNNFDDESDLSTWQ